MSAGKRPQCFFYLLDRHASLAMTKGTKCLILHSLTTPAASRHPSNGGELSPQRQHNKFPSAEGWHASACRGGLSPVASAKGGLSRVTSNKYPPPLSLRRSTINVENVGVRLWQSSAICLRANARSAFLFTGSPRSARDDKGD